MTDPSPVVGGHITTCGVISPDADTSCRLAEGHPGTHLGYDRASRSDIEWHGPHDNQPQWTVESSAGARYDDISWQGHKLWAEACGVLPKWLAYEAWEELVRAVRDAAEVPALRTHATTLQRARELASTIAHYRRALSLTPEDRHAAVVANDALLDLLTGETDV